MVDTLPDAAENLLLVWLDFRGQEDGPLFTRIFRRPLEGAAGNGARERPDDRPI